MEETVMWVMVQPWMIPASMARTADLFCAAIPTGMIAIPRGMNGTGDGVIATTGGINDAGVETDPQPARIAPSSAAMNVAGAPGNGSGPSPDMMTPMNAAVANCSDKISDAGFRYTMPEA